MEFAEILSVLVHADDGTRHLTSVWTREAGDVVIAHIVAADAFLLTDFKRPLRFDLEKFDAQHADRHERNAEVDDISAVPPPVASGKIDERGENIFILAGLSRARPAPIFIHRDEDDERDKEKPDQRVDVLCVKRAQRGCDEDGAYRRLPRRAPQRFQRGMSPRRKRSDAHQE